MRRIAAGTAFLFCSAAIFAQKNVEFRTGRLIKVEEISTLTGVGETSYKAKYLIKVRDGSAENVGFYKVTYFGHDMVKALKSDTDIPYRVSSKSLFLKSPEGHEIKTQLCEQKDEMVRCGRDIFTGIKW